MENLQNHCFRLEMEMKSVLGLAACFAAGGDIAHYFLGLSPRTAAVPCSQQSAGRFRARCRIPKHGELARPTDRPTDPSASVHWDGD